MIVQLNHLFVRRCLDPDELLTDCSKFNTFNDRLEKQAQVYGGTIEEKVNEYKGWGFELFCEMLIKARPLDPIIGIANYELVDESDDNGVDGLGIGTDNAPATVQVKMRPANYILTANEDHLSNFAWQSVVKYGVNPQSKSNMLIITSGNGLHWYTDKKVFMGRVKCLSRIHIIKLVDNILPFWDSFRDSWKAALELPIPTHSDKKEEETIDFKARYLSRDGLACPVCEKYNIGIDNYDNIGKMVYRHMFCWDCNKKWTDTLELQDVHL